MTEPEERSLVPGAHRVIRMLDDTEGPYGGALVVHGSSVAVRVDAAALSGWWGWRHAASEHVAGPLDVARRADGHDVLLPWCTERVTGFLGRRVAAGASLTAGEVSTLVGSLLRGIGEVAVAAGEEESADAVLGGWWLTEGGRPVFVSGRERVGGGRVEGDDVRTSALRIVSTLRHDCEERVLGRALAAVEDGLRRAERQPRLPRALLDRWETELFAVAAPRPLDRDVHAPERVRDIAMLRTVPAETDAGGDTRRARRRRGSRPQSGRTPASRGQASGGQPSRGRGMRAQPVRGRTAQSEPLASVPQRLALLKEGFAEAWRSRRSDARPRPARRAPAGSHSSGRQTPPRRRLLVVAGAAAAAVLAGGLLWPTGATGEQGEAVRSGGRAAGDVWERNGERADGSKPPSDAAAEQGAERSASDEGGAPDEGKRTRSVTDPIAAVPALLRTIGECAAAGDDACTDAVADGSAAVVPMLAGVGEPLIALVDEYGDVAVVRLTADDSAAADAAGEKMLVLVRVNEKWLVRDVYGVADQPG